MARPLTAVAHRGDPYRHRENTLASLRSALERGADAVEVDVRLTRDGVPVLLHDRTLRRLWGHDLPVASLTAAGLRDLTDGGVPALARALEVTAGHRVLLDLPGDAAGSPRALRRVLEAVREAGAEDRVYWSGAASTLLALRAAAPSAELALTWTTSAPPRAGLLAAVRPRWLNYRFGLVTAELVRRLHAEGYLVSAWTADTRRSMRGLARAGVDAVTTNRIDVLAALRDARRPVPDAAP
ncbi:MULTISPECIES: glycerophosphodiester phosphodiesterase [Streptomyces]|uniref:Glycerophosphodiester phosphodiesterase n=1 Tax=Streptomyces chilikensis TaxID=1194079 RepID=A0ABV3ELN9_9ACTN|nr:MULTISPECIES: glycerophosphodiester phosphodiesterase [Streptomyces]MDH6224692.1 glycerophosphoryl diester phosphodiesterase [Streptomyces sp. MJP52]